MFKRIISSGLMMLVFIPVCGQIWTLEDCINYAEEHSIDLQKQNYSIDRERLALQEGKWAFVPKLSASTSYTMSTGRVLDPTTYDFVKTNYTGNSSASVSGELTLFEGGKKIYSLSRAKLSLKAAVLQEQSLKQNLRIQIASAYMDVLCAREQEKIAMETVTMIGLQLDRTNKLFEAGSITETDVLQLHAQLASANKDAASASSAYLMARLVLCDLMEWNDYEYFEVTDLIADGQEYLEWDLESAIEANPGIRLAHIQKDLAATDYKLAVSARYPRLSFSAGYGTSYSDARQKMIVNDDGMIKYESYPFFDQYADNGSAFVSVSLSIPILNGMTLRNGARRAKIASAEANLAIQEMRKKTRMKILQAESEYISAKNLYEHSMEELQYAEEVFRQMERKYELGAIDYIGWLTAFVELVKSRYSMAEAKYTLFLRGEILKYYYL